MPLPTSDHLAEPGPRSACRCTAFGLGLAGAALGPWIALSSTAAPLDLGMGCPADINRTAAGCSIHIQPTRATTIAPPGIEITIGPDGESSIRLSGNERTIRAELVTADRRLPFAPRTAPHPAALLEQLGWPERPSTGAPHLTVRLADGTIASGVYCALDPLELMRAARTQCGSRFPYAGLPDQCLEQVLDARTQGGALTRVLLETCRRDTRGLASRGEACAQRQATYHAITSRLGALSGDDGADTEPGRLLARIEARLGTRREAEISALRAGDLAARKDRLAAALAAAREESTALAERRDRLRAASEAAGGLTWRHTAPLIESLLRAGPCDKARARLDDDGTIGLHAQVGGNRAEDALRDRFEALRPHLPPLRLLIDRGEVGDCVLPLGERWLVLADETGAPARSARIDSGRFRPALPFPDELAGLTAIAAAHPGLAPLFGDGLTPLVWCRSGGEVGVCKRAMYEDLWQFRPNGREAYAGLILLLEERWP